MQALSTRVQRHAVPLKPVDLSDNYGFKAALYVINALSKRTGETAYTEQEARVKVANLIQDSNAEKLSLLLRQWYSEDFDEAALNALVPDLANMILTNDFSRYEHREVVNDIEWSALATAFKCCIAVKMVKSGTTNGNGWKIAVPTPQIFGQGATREDEDTQPGRALVASKSAYEARAEMQRGETANASGRGEAFEASEASEAKSEIGDPPEYQARSIKVGSRKVSFDDESGRNSGSKAAPRTATEAAAAEAVMHSASRDMGDGTGTEPASSAGGSEAGDDDGKVAVKAIGVADEELLQNIEDLKLWGGQISVAKDNATTANTEPYVGEGSVMFEMRLLFLNAFPEAARKGNVNFLN